MNQLSEEVLQAELIRRALNELGQMVCYCAARTGLPGQLLGLTTQCSRRYRSGRSVGDRPPY